MTDARGLQSPRLILLFWPAAARTLRDRIVTRLVQCGALVRAADVLLIDARGLESSGLDVEFEQLRAAGGRVVLADAHEL